VNADAWLAVANICSNFLVISLCIPVVFQNLFPNNSHIVWWIIFFIPVQMFSYMNTVEYILQREIRLTHCIFINWKDFSSFLCQLQHIEVFLLRVNAIECFHIDSPGLQLIHLYILEHSHKWRVLPVQENYYLMSMYFDVVYYLTDTCLCHYLFLLFANDSSHFWYWRG